MARVVMTHGKLGVMTDSSETPKRTVRVPPERWERAKVKAAQRGETVSDAINRFLERYGKTK